MRGYGVIYLRFSDGYCWLLYIGNMNVCQLISSCCGVLDVLTTSDGNMVTASNTSEHVDVVSYRLSGLVEIYKIIRIGVGYLSNRIGLVICVGKLLNV